MRIAIAFLALPGALALLALLAAWAITSMPGRSHRGPLPPLEPADAELASRLRAHVTAIASEEHNVIRAEALERSARYIERELARGGPVVRDEFSVAGAKVRNLEVVVPGSDAQAPVLVIGAHYDSVRHAVGANDNGSGVAALIELARALREKPPGNAEIRLVAFVNEESPWFGTDAMGSLRHARALARSGRRVLGMLSLETIGWYSDEPGSQKYPPPFSSLYPREGNFIGFVGNFKSRDFVRRVVASFRAHAAFPAEGGAFPDAIKDAGRSDQWSYWQQGWPGLMVTDTANFRYPYYHTMQDTPDKVDYERTARVVRGLEAVIRDLASGAG
ncbi:MAG TPA: M20/M25/M40 family metallo-hydrolase [Burkholderiales bacterium]